MSFVLTLLNALPFNWIKFEFMQLALLAVLIITPLCALLGSLAIGNQMAFFSDAIGHACLTGVAIGALLGLSDPTIGMVLFAVALALLLTLLRNLSTTSTDTLIGLVMAFAMALGIALLSRGGEFAKYTRYLIGDILSITIKDITHLALLFIFILVVCLCFYNAMQLTFLNRALARSRGINVYLIDAGFSAMIALVVAISIQWVGLLIINSMLIVPAAAARNVARNCTQYLWLSIAISMISGVLGLIASFYVGPAAGATIVLIATGFYLFSLFFRP